MKVRYIAEFDNPYEAFDKKQINVEPEFKKS